jgi:lipopolysaccharide transport system ATP-binding protein
MKPIIKAEGISKRYRIGAAASDLTLREAVVEFSKAPLKRFKRMGHSSSPEIWALKDVSFVIEPGEVVGVIGRNGAGKSTLLKILSRITEPTTGRVELYGRLGSLLEVGTGFHPELSGRENVFLNGTILGMKRAEIARKFDEIVAFSEIEKFIDTPVKWYSSGMYLRLAFSVAAHLEPEILVLDEVLAVGDTSFQHKCMNKMNDLRNDGRTILFVSHSMQAVTRLCKRAIYLADGALVASGPSDRIASTYLGSRFKISGERCWEEPREAPGNEIVRLCAVRVRTEAGEVFDTADIRRPIRVEMEFEVLQAGQVLVPNFHFTNEEGVYVFVAADHDPFWRNRARPIGRYTSTAWIPGNFLSEGTLAVGAAVSTMKPVVVHFYQPQVIAFQMIDSLDGDSARGDFVGPMPGMVRPLLRWTTQFDDDAKTLAPQLMTEKPL